MPCLKIIYYINPQHIHHCEYTYMCTWYILKKYKGWKTPPISVINLLVSACKWKVEVSKIYILSSDYVGELTLNTISNIPQFNSRSSNRIFFVIHMCIWKALIGIRSTLQYQEMVKFLFVKLITNIVLWMKIGCFIFSFCYIFQASKNIISM